MKVHYTTYSLVFKGCAGELGVPIIERKVESEGVGTIVSAINVKASDNIGNPVDEPSFVVACPDKKFIIAAIDDCIVMDE